MAGRNYYLADGGERSWERKTCVREGLGMLVEWIVQNADHIETLNVTYDPRRVGTPRSTMWVELTTTDDS